MSEKPKKKREKYPVSPIEVHVRNCIHEEIVYENGNLRYRKWGFSPKMFPCGGCGGTSEVLFMRIQLNNKVVQACRGCGVSQPIGPIDARTGTAIATLLESRIVTPDEANIVIERIGISKRFLDPRIMRLIKKPSQRVVSPKEFEVE